MKPLVDVSIPCLLWDGLDFNAETVAREILLFAYGLADIPAPIRSKAVEISVSLTDDETIQILNREFRNKDKPTNVLSFPMLDSDDPLPHDAPRPLGDIVMAFETIDREAGDMAIQFKNHYTHLLIHGLLHLLGYDHEKSKDAKIMEGLEVKILSQLGIQNPYKISAFMA